MTTRGKRNQVLRRRRRGLATLEMVLALPVLLMFMAVMVIVGTAAGWKIRGLSVARNAVWSTRWPRTGGTDPRPEYWPANAGTGLPGAAAIAELDDPRVNQPVARGPLPFGTVVNSQLLDPTLGLRQGTADVNRGLPMLARLGRLRLHADAYILDNKWQYQRMGLGNNSQRRIPVIYALSKAPASYANAYVQAVVSIINAPYRQQIAPLDRDDEYIGYGRLFGWGGSAPDFHPRLQQFCSLDQDEAKTRVTQLTERIEGKVEMDQRGRVTRHIPSVAENMGRGFVGLYQRVIREYRARGMETEIPPLEQKIDTLNQWLQTLLEMQKQKAAQPKPGT